MSLQSSIIANLASVQADMNYLAPMLERPRNYTFEPPPGVPRSNTVHIAHRVPIHDARPVADRVSLDANGFALVNHRSAVRDFFDDETNLLALMWIAIIFAFLYHASAN